MFSLEPDVTRLVEAGLVAANWNKDKYSGMVTDSVVVFVVRDGQPEEHQELGRPDQARRPGHHAEPVHLGRRALERHGRLRRAAQAGKTDEAGRRLPATLFKNVSVQDKSARASLQTFVGGKGDVLLGYENEAIYAQKNGATPVRRPDSTILIENPIAVAEERAEPGRPRRSSTYHAPAGAEDLGRERLPPGGQERPADEAKTSRCRPSSSRSATSSGRLTGLRSKFFDPQNGHRRRKIEQQAQGGGS